MTEEFLGKISHATFGFGGYDGAMIGLSLTFTGESCGVSDFKGWWSGKRSDSCKWTEQDRIDILGKAVLELDDILRKAKKKHVGELVGVPVKVTCKNMTLESWRVLEEVL